MSTPTQSSPRGTDALFVIQDLHVSIGDKEIVKGVSLTVRAGEKHAIMGPNGSGKSTLTNAIMGHPSYTVTSGRVFLDGEDITDLEANEKARRGLFLAFQYPVAVPGVTVANFLRSAVKARFGEERAGKGFRQELKRKFKELEIEETFATRYLNEGFSGGEKKRLEILQMAMLEPSMALLDETDSGLDIDALKVVSEGVNRYSGRDAASGKDTGLIIVTHYQRILNHIRPDFVHIFMGGKFVRSGGFELGLELDERGYGDWVASPDAAA
ncbi:MAG TPA: Fe-S cluster assembly ATPase SufC [Planctomycetota bacterium]|nr:Fe-S cluster assembly ATPase SufC [Planctomycetota bacterium]